MAIEIYAIPTLSGFVPMDEEDWEKKRKYKLGKPVKISISQPRNLGNHRRFMMMLRIVLENIEGEEFKTPNGKIIVINTLEDLLRRVKRQMGHHDESITLGGKKVYDLKSISFSSMDEKEFQNFFSRALDAIVTFFLPCDLDALREETENRIRIKPIANRIVDDFG